MLQLYDCSSARLYLHVPNMSPPPPPGGPLCRKRSSIFMVSATIEEIAYSGTIGIRQHRPDLCLSAGVMYGVVSTLAADPLSPQQNDALRHGTDQSGQIKASSYMVN